MCGTRLKASASSESQPSSSEAETQLTFFSNPQNPPRTPPVHDATHIPRSHFLSGVSIVTSVNDTSALRAREHLRSCLHLTNPCTKRKVLSLTKQKGKIYKTKSLGHYITIHRQIISLYRNSSVLQDSAKCFKMGPKLGWLYVSQISYPWGNVIPSIREGIFLIYILSATGMLSSWKEICHYAYLAVANSSLVCSTRWWEHIYGHPQTVSLYYNSSVWLDTREASSWDHWKHWIGSF